MFLQIALNIVGKIFCGHVHGGADLFEFFHLGDGVIQRVLVARYQGLQVGHPLLQFQQVGRGRGQILGLCRVFLASARLRRPASRKVFLYE